MSAQRLTSTLFLLTVFLLPTQLGKHFWPSFSIVNGIRVDYLSPTIFLTDVLIGMLFLCWLWEKLRGGSQAPKPSLDFIDKLMIGLGVIGVASNIFFSTNPLVSGIWVLKICEIVFWGGICYSQLLQSEIRKHALIAIACSCLLQSLLALAQYFQHGSIGGIVYYLGERTFTADTPGIANASIQGTLVLRPYGTLPHPNVLAGYLLLSSLVMVAEFARQHTAVKNILSVSVSVSFLALMSTLSRVALVLSGLLVFLGLLRHSMTAQYRKIYLWRKYVLAFCIGVAIISILLLFPVSGRFLSSSLIEESWQQREQLSRAAFAMLASQPIVGVGLHTFLINLPEYSAHTAPVALLQPVHNIFLLVASELGLLGELVMSYFLIRTLLHSLKRGVIYSLPILVMLVLGLTDHYFLTLQQGLLLTAFIVGFTWATPPSK